MNKKFSTLMVGALLTGGLFNTASAIDLTKAESGQYYKLKRTAQYALSSWADVTDNYYVVNNNGEFQLSNVFSEDDSYWTVEKRTTVSGTIEVRLKNVKTGKYLDLGSQDKYFTVSYLAAGATDWDNFTPTEDANALQWGSNFAAVKELPWKIEAGTVAGGEYLLGINAEPVRTSCTIETINDKLDKGFGLQFGQLKDDKFSEYTLKGAEAFNGQLVATDNIDGNSSSNSAAEFYIFNSASKKYVVLLKDRWSNNGTDLLTGNGKGFKFALMSAKEIKADQALTTDKQKIASMTFKVAETLHAIGNRLEVVAVDAYTVSGTTYDAEVFVAEVDGTNYLTTNVATVDAAGNLTNGDADKIATHMNKTWVRFGMTNNINVEDFYGYAVTVKGTAGENKGKTINPADADEWVKIDYVALTKPEGQWIATTDENGLTAWKNRETDEDAKNFFNYLRHVKDNIYVDANGNKYELNKTDKLGGDETFEYYGEYEANDVDNARLHSYKIAFKNKTSDEMNYVGLDGKGNLVLTNKVANAIVFDLNKVALTNDLKANGAVKKNALVDEFRIINNAMIKNDDDKWVYTENADTISFYRYKFVYNGKFLAYGDDELVLVDKEKDADFFVIKEKDGDAVNVLNVGDTDYDDVSGSVYDLEKWEIGRTVLSGAKMLYFDNNHALLKQQSNIYRWEANAQLTIDDKTMIEYRTLAAHDTLEFYRTEYSDEFLFEHGQFLGMTYNREKYNPAIFVDTAYVRNETAKPMYMLAVGVDKTDASMVCPICGKADCEHAEEVPGMISARYLVSFTDSVAAHAAEVKNPFYYTGTKMTKLGFIPAVHNVDSLFIPFKDVENGYTHWTLGYDVTPVTFAFRIVDAETQDFIIETGRLADETKAYNSKNNGYNTAWVKWHNGCPVLTNDIAEAEVFNVRETSATPTANDEIAASEVSIIAANGSIIVKGAAGKTVAISNILGQTIANAVVSSDNETIAVPAGIAVVAVEGEEAVKVVVK